MKIYFKRFCVAVLIIAMLSSLYTALAADKTTNDSFLNSGEIGLLEMLDILPEENPDFSKAVTRGELAYIIAKICNVNVDDYKDTAPKFYDLTQDYKYFSHIQACVEMGIFSGDGTGYFLPDDDATYLQACKVFSIVLGYKVPGYFTSYINTAHSSGIDDKVEMDDTLTLGDALQMAHNTLHANMLENTSYGNTDEYAVNKERTALEVYHNIEARYGLLDGIYGSQLSMPDSSISEDEVRIDGIRYKYSSGENMFGRNVIFYVDDESENNSFAEILYMYPDYRRINELVIDAEDMMSKNGETVLYSENNKNKKIKFSDIGDMVINGVSYPDYTDADFLPSAGRLTFIDNENDGIYDVVIIKEFEFVIVDGVDAENKIIYDKQNPANIFGSKTNDDVIVNVLYGDEEAHFSVLVSDTPVAICKSRNTVGIIKINVYLPDETVSGVIDSISNTSIGVDKSIYKLSNGKVYDEPISVGDVVDMGIFDGKIGVVVHKKDSYLYGYLLKAAKSTKSLDPTLEIKLFNTNRKMSVYECAENLRIDEIKKTNADAALSALKASAASTYRYDVATRPYSQAIRYKLNSEGKISDIDTCTYDSSLETENSLQLDAAAANLKFSGTSQSFYDVTDGEKLMYSITSATTKVVLPDLSKEDEAEWYPTGFSANGSYYVEGYNVNPYSRSVDFLVAYSTNGLNPGVSGAAVPYIVSDVKMVMDENGNTKKQVKLVGVSRSEIERVFHETLTDTEVSVGDVIRFSGGTTDEIVAVSTVFKGNEIPTLRSEVSGTASSNGFSFETQIGYAYGTAVSKSNDNFVITTSRIDDSDGIEAYKGRTVYRSVSNVPVWIYDKNGRNKLTEGTWSDVIPYETNQTDPTEVFICTQSGTLKFVYICK